MWSNFFAHALACLACLTFQIEQTCLKQEDSGAQEDKCAAIEGRERDLDYGIGRQKQQM